MKLQTSLLLAVSSLLLPGLVQAQGNFDNVEYEVSDLGHGIYMLVGQGGNIGLSVGEDGAFLIDDQFAPLTPKLLAAVRSVTDQPVKFVLNTHWHGDHTGGNANLAGKGALIMAHDNVRSRMAAPGDQQSPKEALPVITYSESSTYYLNGHEIHAFHVEHAHTDGDSIVVFKDANIIHSGDVLFNGIYPYIDLGSGGSVSGYIAAMEKLASLCDDSTRIISGHGPAGNKAAVRKSLKMVQSAQDSVAALVKQGKSLEEVKEANPLAKFDDEWSWAFINTERFTEILYNDLSQ